MNVTNRSHSVFYHGYRRHKVAIFAAQAVDERKRERPLNTAITIELYASCLQRGDDPLGASIYERRLVQQ